jgi:hypothetical protein
MENLKAFIGGFKDGFQSFGYTITVVINSTLMTLVYFLFVGPTSLAARIAKKSFLDVSNEKKASYWEELGLDKEEKENYYDQF